MWVEGELIAGEGLRRMARANEAIAAFERVLARAPDHAGARIGLGWALKDAGRDEEASRVWRPLVGSGAHPGVLEMMRGPIGGPDHSAAVRAAPGARVARP